MKITIIGAGAVGATCADNIARKNLAKELVLLDIKEGLAEGKAIDIMQAASLLNFSTNIRGVTNDYSKTAGSNIVVVTSGIPRKPGMSREELISTNAKIVKSAVVNLLKYSPDAIIILISNPMDTMTYLTVRTAGISKNHVIGMGGILDGARFNYHLAQALNCSPSDLQTLVIGGHGDETMIPLLRLATYRGSLVANFLNVDSLNKAVNDTMKGGAILTKLMGTSAWYAPGAAVAALVASIVHNERRLFTCCVALNGEYKQHDICLGVPVIIGQEGWEQIVDVQLETWEQEAFNKSAAAVRVMNQSLSSMDLC